MVLNGFVVLQDEQIEHMNELLPQLFAGQNPNFHIYIIGSRPRISINPRNFKVTEKVIEIEFIVHNNGERLAVPVRLAQHPERPVTDLETSWPHNYFRFLSGKDEVLEAKAALFASTLTPGIRELQPYTNLDVLYVGQAYGDAGEREAKDRLQSHSTLQKILGETSRLQPDREVWLVMLNFDELLVASFDGTLATAPGALEADEGRLERMLSSSISEQQKINFTEAALIRYFEPRFNEVFRKSFPSPAHKTYAECYALDLNMVSVEMDTTDMRFWFYSACRPASWLHIAKFPLHDPKERRYMFDLLHGKPS